MVRGVCMLLIMPALGDARRRGRLINDDDVIKMDEHHVGACSARSGRQIRRVIDAAGGRMRAGRVQRNRFPRSGRAGERAGGEEPRLRRERRNKKPPARPRREGANAGKQLVYCFRRATGTVSCDWSPLSRATLSLSPSLSARVTRYTP